MSQDNLVLKDMIDYFVTPDNTDLDKGLSSASKSGSLGIILYCELSGRSGEHKY